MKMKSFALPLLLSFRLQTLVTAQTSTYKQGEPESYIGDAIDPGSIDANDIVVDNDGDMSIKFGADISKKIIDTAKEHCEDPISEQCQTNIREVMGVGAVGDGVQRRLLGIGGAGVAISVITAFLIPQIWTRLEESNNPIHLDFAKDRIANAAELDISEENKIIIETDEGEQVELMTDTRKSTGSPLGVVEEENGDLHLYFPDEVKEDLRKAFVKDGCSVQSPITTRQEVNRTKSAIEQAFKCGIGFMREMQQAARGANLMHAENLLQYKPDTGLSIDVYNRLEEYGETLYFGGDDDKSTLKAAARTATWAGQVLAFAEAAAERAIDPIEGGIVIPLPNLKKGGFDLLDVTICPTNSEPPWCGQCGGNALPHDDGPLDPPSKIEILGRCQGLEDGVLAGCKCSQEARTDRNTPDAVWAQMAFDILFNLPNEDEDTTFEMTECYTPTPDEKNAYYIHEAQVEKVKADFCAWVAEKYQEGERTISWNYNEYTPDSVSLKAVFEDEDYVSELEDLNAHCLEKMGHATNDCTKDNVFMLGGRTTRRSEDNSDAPIIYDYTFMPQYKREWPIPEETSTICLWRPVEAPLNGAWYVYGGRYAGQDYGEDFVLPAIGECEGGRGGWSFEYFPETRGSREWYAFWVNDKMSYECVKNALIKAGASDNFECVYADPI